MATHSSILAWRTSWTEEPSRLQSVGHKELDRTEHTCHKIYICILYMYKTYLHIHYIVYYIHIFNTGLQSQI